MHDLGIPFTRILVTKGEESCAINSTFVNERERERDRQTDRQTQRERERHRDRERVITPTTYYHVQILNGR